MHYSLSGQEHMRDQWIENNSAFGSCEHAFQKNNIFKQ